MCVFIYQLTGTQSCMQELSTSGSHDGTLLDTFELTRTAYGFLLHYLLPGVATKVLRNSNNSYSQPSTSGAAPTDSS